MITKAMFSSSTIPVLEQSINFAQDRHQVLVGNLANLDTPGYRVRDLSPEEFESRLKDAIVTRDSQRSISSFGTSRSAFGASRGQDAVAALSDTKQGILYHDDSNVSVEQQIAEINKNQTRHNLALAIMTSQFRLLQAAISERA